MWRKYKRRVLLAMSSQAFAQLVSCVAFFLCSAAEPARLAEWHKRYAIFSELRHVLLINLAQLFLIMLVRHFLYNMLLTLTPKLIARVFEGLSFSCLIF